MSLVAAKIFLVPVAVDPLSADAFGAPKVAVGRGLMYLLLVVGAAYVVRVRPRLPGSRLLAAAAVFVGVGALSTALALDQYSALFGAHRRYLGLTSMVDGLVLAISIAMFVRTRSNVLLVAIAAAGSIIANIVYATAQGLTLDPLRIGGGTISGLVGNSTSLGGLMVAASAGGFALSVAIWRRIGVFARVVLAAFCGACIIVILVAGARAGLLALPGSAMAAFLFASRASGAHLGRRIAAVLASIVLFGVLAVGVGPVRERLARLVTGDPSVIERLVVYETAVKAFASRPLLGVGPDGLGAVYLEFRSPQTAGLTEVLTATQTSTHSWVLHNALGIGVLGLLAFLAVLAAALRRAWIRGTSEDGLPSVVAAGALSAVLLQGVVTIDSVTTSLFVWTAIGVIAAEPTLRPASEASSHRLPALTPLLLVAVLLGAAFATTVVNSVEASRAVQTSNLARGAGNQVIAQRAALHAAQLDPGRADNWNVLGLAYSGRDRDRAVGAFRRASEQAPRDPVYLLNWAAEELRYLQRDPRADPGALVSRAMALDPNGPITMRRSAEVLAVLGRGDDAVAAATRAIELLPRDPGNHRALALALAAATRHADAARAIEKAISLTQGQAGLPGRSLPLEVRLELSRYYRPAGRIRDAQALFDPPAMLMADRSCEPRSGRTAIADGRLAPRCVRVQFGSEEALWSGGDSDSVDSVANYQINSAPLPPGSLVEWDGKLTTVIQLPPTAPPPPRESVVSVKNVRNILGQQLRVPALTLTE